MSPRAAFLAIGLSTAAVGAAGWWWVVGNGSSGAADEVPASRPASAMPPPMDYGFIDPDIAERIRQARVAVAADKSNAGRWRRLAEVYDANDAHESARQCYEQVVRLAPDDERGWYHLATMRADLGDLDGAVKAMRRVIELEPDYGPAHRRLGFLLFDRGELVDAEAAFRAATEVDPDDSAAWVGVGRAQMQQDAFEDAAEVLERVADSDAANARYASQLLGRAYRHLGRLEQAQAAAARGFGTRLIEDDPWRSAIERHRSGLTAAMREAGKLLERGRRREAVEVMERLRQEHPEEVGILTALGTTYRAVQRHEDSIRVLDQAVKIRGGYYPAHLELARSYAGGGLRDKALHHVERALQLNPTLAAAHAVRADLLVARGDVRGAAEAFDRAARCEPTNPMWFYRAGWAHFQTGQWEKAADALTVVTLRAPDTAQAFHLLGVARMNLGQLEQAEAALRRAGELTPSDPAVKAALRQLEQAGDGP